MQQPPVYPNWLLNADYLKIADLCWEIKDREAELLILLETPCHTKITKRVQLLQACTDLYVKLSHFYPPVETPSVSKFAVSKDANSLIHLWQKISLQIRQTIQGEDKAQLIAMVLDCLSKMTLMQRYHINSAKSPGFDTNITFEQLSAWFLSFIDLIRHQQNNPGWANDFFKQLDANAFRDLYQILVHPDTAHLMFHVYYYHLFPDQLSSHSKHPDFLISLDHRLKFLYQRIEQFVETFILFSKTQYQFSPQDFLCHGRQLPKGINLRSKENYRMLIIQGLKKLSSAFAISEQTPTTELIDAIKRSYQFWFNPKRILDALFLLCKSLDIDVTQCSFQQQLYDHMVKAFLTLETGDCVHLYGYFSNNDTRYLLRILHYLGNGGTLPDLPVLHPKQTELIRFLYHAYSQVILALVETLNRKQLPCSEIIVPETTKPPKPSRRNIEAICHVIQTYCQSSSLPISETELLLTEIENCLSEQTS